MICYTIKNFEKCVKVIKSNVIKIEKVITQFEEEFEKIKKDYPVLDEEKILECLENMKQEISKSQIEIEKIHDYSDEYRKSHIEMIDYNKKDLLNSREAKVQYDYYFDRSYFYINKLYRLKDRLLDLMISVSREIRNIENLQTIRAYEMKLTKKMLNIV